MTSILTPAWRLVPVEPTLDMSIAFGETFYIKSRAIDDDYITDWWQAMLEAAPSPELPAERARLVQQAKTQGWLVANAAGNWGSMDNETKRRIARLNDDIDALAAAPAPASVQPVAVRWEVKLPTLGWQITTGEEAAADMKRNGWEVRALGVIDPTPAERVQVNPSAAAPDR
jgi:hypothetical protein